MRLQNCCNLLPTPCRGRGGHEPPASDPAMRLPSRPTTPCTFHSPDYFRYAVAEVARHFPLLTSRRLKSPPIVTPNPFSTPLLSLFPAPATFLPAKR